MDFSRHCNAMLHNETCVCVCIQYFANWRVKIAHIDTRSDPKTQKFRPPRHLAQGLANLPGGSVEKYWIS